MAAPGQEAALVGLRFHGFDPRSTTLPLLAKVTGSDGQSVTFDYTSLADPESPLQYVSLTAAHYGAGTQALYRYEVQNITDDTGRALLVETDDPRYPEKAKKVRYTYHNPPP